jgi:hypothetical protein
VVSFFLCPEFEDDPDLYVLKPIKYVGIEVWQVGHKSQFGMLVGLIIMLQALTIKYTMNGVK